MKKILNHLRIFMVALFMVIIMGSVAGDELYAGGGKDKYCEGNLIIKADLYGFRIQGDRSKWGHKWVIPNPPDIPDWCKKSHGLVHAPGGDCDTYAGPTSGEEISQQLFDKIWPMIKQEITPHPPRQGIPDIDNVIYTNLDIYYYYICNYGYVEGGTKVMCGYWLEWNKDETSFVLHPSGCGGFPCVLD
jgi:hypothetical protein